MNVTIRTAGSDDLQPIVALLRGADLPLDGLAEHFGEGFAVAEIDGRIAGAEGIERYGDDGLLRSAVVDPSFRGHGVGEALTRDRLSWAATNGLRSVWLLTTTAADYFPRFGFQAATRADAPALIRASHEFVHACPASAVAMRLVLSD